MTHGGFSFAFVPLYIQANIPSLATDKKKCHSYLLWLSYSLHLQIALFSLENASLPTLQLQSHPFSE